MKLKFKLFLQNDGYTLVETLISIFLLSLISVTLLTNFSKIELYNLKITNSLQLKLETLQLRYILMQEIERIEPPWFLAEYKIEHTSNHLKIFYYKGERDSFLELISTDCGVSIEINNKRVFKTNFIKGDFSFKGGYIKFENNSLTMIIPLGAFIA